MNNDHEIAFMYAPNPWGMFQPRANLYSPFSNVVLRVVQPARPTLEDIVFQLFASDNEPTRQADAQIESPMQAETSISESNNSGLNDDLSERMAREMQEQEDREQAMRDRALAMRTQFGGLMSSFLGGFNPGGENVGSIFREQQVNAEAGPSTTKSPAPRPVSGSTVNVGNLHYPRVMSEKDEPMPDDSDKKAGKKPARTTQLDPTYHSPSELLDNFEAALRHEVNRFDFPEQLDFLDRNASPAERPLPPSSCIHPTTRACIHLKRP